MMDDRHRDQLAAYALGALDAGEAREFEQHLAGCPDCRAELDAHRGVAGALAAGAPSLRAPKGVREAVMAEVRAEASVLRAAGPSADRVPRRRRPALALAGAVAVAAAAGLGFVLGGGGGPETRTISAQVTPAAGARARAAVERRGAAASLRVEGFREPGRGRVYQVWLRPVGGGMPAPTRALFTVDQNGGGVVELPRSARAGRVLLVTSEPDGGSPTGVPSRAPVLSARL